MKKFRSLLCLALMAGLVWANRPAPAQTAAPAAKGTPAANAKAKSDAAAKKKAANDARKKAREAAEAAEAAPAGPAPEIASAESATPSINGPRITGSTPGKPFLFLIPATGEGPLAYAAEGLPEGLKLDAQTGIISGTLKAAGTTAVTIKVTGPKGEASRKLTIVGGENKLALTPPMGWNSWNVWARAVDDAKVRAAADAMVKSGLAAHGFQYINIDDTWEAGRDAEGRILCNEKFPDMKALADYVHSKGLKLGIYSSPGPKTCANFEGSYQHEKQDALTYAEWGIDYLKYDWCSYGQIFNNTQQTLDDRKAPYALMGKSLGMVGRDIVYSLCQYGAGDVWTWGASVGGNCWRTTGDITDRWISMSEKGFGETKHAEYAGPGHWNDPDMLVVGKVGWGPSLHASRLTPDEQVTHISLWCMVSSPLLIGCDMTALDKFTVDVLGNDEVLAINQDPLGKAGKCIDTIMDPAIQAGSKYGCEVWSRPLWDGTTAVGLFNRGKAKGTIKADFAKLGIAGEQPVRDLWRKKDLGKFKGSFSIEVPPHGAVMLKIGKPKAQKIG